MSRENPTASDLLAAYALGEFPMADPGTGELGWQSPDPRAVLPLDGFRVPSSLREVVGSGRFEIRLDTAFDEIVEACARSRSRSAEPEYWLDQRLVAVFRELHREGAAHSVEAWRGGALVGGLFGGHVGAAFFGESMFHRPEAGGTDASKVCLVHLVEILRAGGFELLDVQYLTPHLARFGCVEIPRAHYLERLGRAVRREGAWPDGGPG